MSLEAIIIIALVALLMAVTIVSTFMVVRREHVEKPQTNFENQFELMETKISGVKSDLRKLSGEWVEYHSRLDTLIRRGIRLGVLERQGRDAPGPNGPDEAAAAPQSRSELLADFRRRTSATPKSSS